MQNQQPVNGCHLRFNTFRICSVALITLQHIFIPTPPLERGLGGVLHGY